jgi:SAM-dependent methyltransferase
MPTLTEANWYDYPWHYELLFRAETRAEAAFVESACRKYCAVPVRRILEPGCGSGRMVVALAARGYDVTGLDVNQPSLDYLRRRLARRGLRAATIAADMAEFRLPRRVDAAFSLWNTFRHLKTESAARRHLECVAASLRPGGIYLLGLHLLPLDVAEESVERWSARHGRTRVSVTLRTVGSDRRRRLETLRAVMRIRSPRRDLRLATQFQFRMYTAAQFRRLLTAVPALELCDIYDFWFEIDRPLKLNDEIADAVFVLRKR